MPPIAEASARFDALLESMRRKAAEGSTIPRADCWAALAAGLELKAEMIAAQASPREIEALNQVLDNLEIWWLTSAWTR